MPRRRARAADRANIWKNPATRVEDFRCAADYLVMLPYVDILVVPGATHYDLHDKPECVGQAVAKLKAFYGENL